MNCSREGLPVCIAAAALLMAAGYAVALAESVPPALVANIVGKLNTGSAKVGDVVTATTVNPAKLNDGTDVARDSVLSGKVVAVQSKQAGGGTSLLAIKFDQLQVKGGAAVAIKGLIVAIGPVPPPALESDADWGLSSGRHSSGPMPAAPKLSHSREGQSGDSSDVTLRPGSTLDHVSLAQQLDALGASELRGEKRDIKLDSEVLIKVALQ